MATRRCAWTDAQRNSRITAFDHGVPCFSAKDATFRAAVAQAVHAGWLTTWQPRLHPQSLPCPDAEQGSAHFIAAPDMPQWCRHLVQGAIPRWEQAVQGLRRTPRGWVVESSDLLWADASTPWCWPCRPRKRRPCSRHTSASGHSARAWP